MEKDRNFKNLLLHLYKYKQLHKYILFNIQKYQSHHQLSSYGVLLPTAKPYKAFNHDTAFTKPDINQTEVTETLTLG